MADRDPRKDPTNGDIFLGDDGYRSVVPHPDPNNKRDVISVVMGCLDKPEKGVSYMVLCFQRAAFLRWAKSAMIFRRAEECEVRS